MATNKRLQELKLRGKLAQLDELIKLRQTPVIKYCLSCENLSDDALMYRRMATLTALEDLLQD